MSNQPQRIIRNIVAGEIFEHTGSIQLIGNIEENATVSITDGGIQVSGTIADNVTIETKTKSMNASFNNVSITGRNGSIIISGSGNIVMNGQTIISNGNMGFAGVIVEGNVGHHVTIKSNGPVELQKNAASYLDVVTDGSFRGKLIGEHGSLKIDGSLVLDTLGPYGSVRSDGSIKIGRIEHDCDIKGDGSIKVDVIGAGTKIKADGSVKADRAERDVRIKSDGSITIEKAHSSVVAKGDGSVKIKERFGNDENDPPRKDGIFTL